MTSLSVSHILVLCFSKMRLYSRQVVVVTCAGGSCLESGLLSSSLTSEPFSVKHTEVVWARMKTMLTKLNTTWNSRWVLMLVDRHLHWSCSAHFTGDSGERWTLSEAGLLHVGCPGALFTFRNSYLKGKALKPEMVCSNDTSRTLIFFQAKPLTRRHVRAASPIHGAGFWAIWFVRAQGPLHLT